MPLIKGLMNATDAQFLADITFGHKKILELGSYLGGSTRIIADNTDGFVIACDNFKGPEDIVLTWKERQEIYDNFIANMGEYIPSGRVLPWIADHRALDISTAPRPPKYDMVFIDGSHRLEDVKRDIKFGLSVLESGGLICGHDYDVGCPSVVMACNELFDGFKVGDHTRIWWKVIE